MRRTTNLRLLPALAVAAASGCALPWLSPPPPPPPPPPPAYDFPHDMVWTAHPRIELAQDSARAVVPRVFTALTVLGADSMLIRVRCDICPGAPVGEVRHRDVVYAPKPPASAAHGSLAEFAIALRDAAFRADLDALAPLMASDFTFALVGPQGADRARAAWAAEGFQLLRHIPALLDQGLASADGAIWVAPPLFADRLDYQGLRLGLRRSPHGTWEWIFLVRGQGVAVPR